VLLLVRGDNGCGRCCDDGRDEDKGDSDEIKGRGAGIGFESDEG